MQNRRLRSQLDSLNSLLDRTKTASQDDIELMGHWGKYLCILTAGFLENALEEVYGNYVQNSANPRVRKFAQEKLGHIYNPKANRFVETARSFDSEWANRLKEYLDEDAGQRRDAIDSVMNNRHQIAHGGVTSISVGRIRQYLVWCIEVVEFIEDQTH